MFQPSVQNPWNVKHLIIATYSHLLCRLPWWWRSSRPFSLSNSTGECCPSDLVCTFCWCTHAPPWTTSSGTPRHEPHRAYSSLSRARPCRVFPFKKVRSKTLTFDPGSRVSQKLTCSDFLWPDRSGWLWSHRCSTFEHHPWQSSLYWYCSNGVMVYVWVLKVLRNKKPITVLFRGFLRSAAAP